MIAGKIVRLVSAVLDDRQRVYDWCFHSETTKSHAGPPDYPNVVIPSYDEFYSEYAEYFFTGATPCDGQGYIIQHDGEAAGFISYTCFHLLPGKAEFDLWMNSETNCGRGFGSDAIMALAIHVRNTLGIGEVIMRPSAKNTRAIAAYKKAGFEESDLLPGEYLRAEYIALYGDGDYGVGGTALLRLRMTPVTNSAPPTISPVSSMIR